jgi:hypothetical protein
VARVFQFSTQSGDAVRNARLALDAPRDLAPASAALLSAGMPDVAEDQGHVWAFSPKTQLAKTGDELRPCDVGLRIEPGMLTCRVYEVLAFLPDQPKLPEQVNGAPWFGGGLAYPNVAIFKPFHEFSPAHDFLALVEALRGSEPYISGQRYEARFLPFDADTLLRYVLTTDDVPMLPPTISISGSAIRRRRLTNVRDGGSLFRNLVFAAQRRPDGRLECAACDHSDERILEAAHIIDYGRAEDRWWNGLPLCRNHHRWFDLDVLRLSPERVSGSAPRRLPISTSPRRV